MRKNSKSQPKFTQEEKYLDFPLGICTIKGRKKGPKVMIMSGVHGGEVSAIKIVYELMEMLKEKQDLAGEITIIPIVNLPAAIARTRESPIDYKNLNGVYPKKAQNGTTFSNILRFHIEKLAKEHDFLLDIHSSTLGAFSPHVGAASLKKSYLNYACEFGSEFILFRERTGTSNSVHKRAVEEGTDNITTAVTKNSKTLGFAFEAGSGNFITSNIYKNSKTFHS